MVCEGDQVQNDRIRDFIHTIPALKKPKRKFDRHRESISNNQSFPTHLRFWIKDDVDRFSTLWLAKNHILKFGLLIEQ